MRADTTREGSRNARLAKLDVGEVLWTETELPRWQHDMRMLIGVKSRRPAVLEGRKFVSALFTAVGTNKAGDIHYLIRTERIE